MKAAGSTGKLATYRDGRLMLDVPVDWPEGTRVRVEVLPDGRSSCPTEGHVVIAGFGLCGRYVAELLDQSAIPYVIIEKNVETVETQRALGRRVLPGDVTDSATLTRAGLDQASILALTVPDEDAVLEATSLARRLHPGVYIIARTTYASKGMQASRLGADEVIKAEHAVAIQFYDRLRNVLCERRAGQAEPNPESAASSVGNTSNH